MIIDGHAHSCGRFFTLDGILAELDACGADKVVLCQGIQNEPREYRIPVENWKLARRPGIIFTTNKLIRFAARRLKSTPGIPERNAYVRNLADTAGGRIIPFAWLNPNAPEFLTAAEEAMSRGGFRGFKLHQATEEFPCCAPVLDDLAEIARRHRVPIFIHLYSRREVVDFGALVERHPKTSFICAHLAGLEILAPLAERLGNLYWDISPAFGSPPERIRLAIARFGAGRVVLGSDTPFGKDSLRKNIAKVRRMRLDAPAERAILGGNLSRLLSLD
jgi:hypothetical protein